MLLDRVVIPDPELVVPLSTTLTISPATNWTNIAAAGGQRTVSVSTNAPTYTLFRPTWMTHQFITGGFILTATVNTTASTRTGTVTVTAGNQSRSFTVSQLAGGAQRTVSVSTNAPTYTLSRPTWITHQFVTGGFILTATQNTGSARTGTVSVTAGNLTRSFTVSQLGNTILTFHGGFGAPALQQLQRQPGTAIGTMPSNPTRPGFDFTGWFTNMTGGTRITSSSIVPNSYTRFFAQWTPRNVTLTFAGNSGTPSSQPITRQARSTTGAMPTNPNRAGFTFVGWFDTSAATGGTNFASNSPVPINNATYWARWTPNSNVVITFNGNGGTPVAQPLAKQPGTNMGSMPSNPTRAGFTFAGWFSTSATTGGNQITSSSIVPTVSTTYWARWTVNPTWVWNCDSGHVGFWPSTINVHTHTLGPVSDTFVYHYRMLQAQREWNNALNVPIVGVTQATNAQIRSFGGTRAHIDAFRNEGPSGWAGLAEFAPNTPEQVITVRGVSRGVHRFFDQSRIFTVERPNADEVLMVAIHELGHALGYWGHSSSSHDVMWQWVSTNTTLQTNERRHMRQIYDFFR